MMALKALTDGNVIDLGVDERDTELESLRLENRRLTRALSDAKLDADRAREDASRAMANLRRVLSPLYRGLQMVFGELDAAGVADTSPAGTAMPAAGPSAAAGTDPRIAAVWESWKSRLPPACGKVIDALLLHGELNSVQIKVAARLGTSTVSDSISKLNKAGLINKNGGRFSLKAL